MASADGEETKKTTTRRRTTDYITMALISLSYGLTFLFRTSIGPITDAIESEYGVTSTGVGLLSSSYFLSYTLAQQPWGLYLQLYACQSALVIANLSLSVLALSFPFSPPSIWVGSLIFFLVGVTTGCTFTVALIFGGQRFGSDSVSFCGGLTLITGTVHNLIGSVVQAQLYEQRGLWKPLYFGIAVLALLYAVVALLCIRCEVDEFSVASLRKQSSSKPSPRELANMEMSPCRQLQTTMRQTVAMHRNWMLGVIGFCVGVVFFGILSL